VVFATVPKLAVRCRSWVEDPPPTAIIVYWPCVHHSRSPTSDRLATLLWTSIAALPSCCYHSNSIAIVCVVRVSSRSLSGPLECLTFTSRTPLKGLSLPRLDCRPDPCSTSTDPPSETGTRRRHRWCISSTCPSLSLPAIRLASSTRDRLRLRPPQSLSFHAHGCCSYHRRIERSWLFHHGLQINTAIPSTVPK
jgi:hypothetical protein